MKQFFSASAPYLRQFLTCKPLHRLCFVVYIGALSEVTLLSRTAYDRGANLELFWSYRLLFSDHSPEAFKLLFGNIALLIPWGFLLPLLTRFGKHPAGAVLSGAMTSLTIELLQLKTGLGLFELDDLLNNTIGALLGWCLWHAASRISEKNVIKHLDN